MGAIFSRLNYHSIILLESRLSCIMPLFLCQVALLSWYKPCHALVLEILLRSPLANVLLCKWFIPEYITLVQTSPLFSGTSMVMLRFLIYVLSGLFIFLIDLFFLHNKILFIFKKLLELYINYNYNCLYHQIKETKSRTSIQRDK